MVEISSAFTWMWDDDMDPLNILLWLLVFIVGGAILWYISLRIKAKKEDKRLKALKARREEIEVMHALRRDRDRRRRGTLGSPY